MSHVVICEIQIRDIDCLEKACKEAGLELRRGQRTYRWYNNFVNDYHGENAAFNHGIDPKDYGKCDHAIGIPGNKSAYEIGVVKKPDGTYALIWDFYAGGYGLEKVAGKNCQNVTKAYSMQVAKKHLKAKGYSLQSTKTLADGSVEMVFNSY